MKKLIIILVLFAACKKTDTSTVPAGAICASCEEQKSHYKPADYCGTLADVNAYIDGLKTNGAKLGQTWVCKKY